MNRLSLLILSARNVDFTLFHSLTLMIHAHSIMGNLNSIVAEAVELMSTIVAAINAHIAVLDAEYRNILLEKIIMMIIIDLIKLINYFNELY